MEADCLRRRSHGGPGHRAGTLLQNRIGNGVLEEAVARQSCGSSHRPTEAEGVGGKSYPRNHFQLSVSASEAATCTALNFCPVGPPQTGVCPNFPAMCAPTAAKATFRKGICRRRLEGAQPWHPNSCVAEPGGRSSSIRSPARIRESLETHDPARAELLRRRIELKVELCDPRFRAADIPARLRDQVAHFQRITLRSGFLPVLVRAVKHRHEQADFCPPERLIS